MSIMWVIIGLGNGLLDVGQTMYNFLNSYLLSLIKTNVFLKHTNLTHVKKKPGAVSASG